MSGEILSTLIELQAAGTKPAASDARPLLKVSREDEVVPLLGHVAGETLFH
jgi:hypothetical protein